MLQPRVVSFFFKKEAKTWRRTRRGNKTSQAQIIVSYLLTLTPSRRWNISRLIVTHK